jgi:branched-chain amino acid transport system substrate-binding protein
MTRKRWLQLLAPIGAAALIFSACGDDGGSSDSGSTDEPVEEGPPAKGEPVKIGIIYTGGVEGIDLVDVPDGAEAAAEYVNTELGGFDGHPVEIVACNDNGDAAEDVSCGEQFVEEDVIAVGGIAPQWGDNGMAVVAEAGIPSITIPVSNAEFLGENSWPLDGGSAAAFPALAKYFAEDVGIESASIMHADLAVGELAATALLADPLMERGVEDITLVPETVGTADFTSAVVQATEDDPDVLFVLFGDADCVRIFDAAEQLGVESAIAAPGSCASSVNEEGGAEGTVFNAGTLYYDDSDEQAQDYQAAIERYGDEGESGFSAGTFSQVLTLKELVDELGFANANAQAIFDLLEAGDGFPIYLATTWDASRAATLAGTPTHVYNPDQRIIEIQDGEFVDVGGGWVNGFED